MRIDGRDSWKVTAVQTLDLCLVCDLGLGCCHSGEECCGECEPRHDLLCVQCFEPRACLTKSPSSVIPLVCHDTLALLLARRPKKRR